MTPAPQRPRRARTIAAMAVAAVLVVAGALAVWAFAERAPEPRAAPSSAAPPLTTATPVPSPTETGAPADTGVYALEGLPRVDVYSLLPALPVDDAPGGAFTGELVHARADLVPVFPAPGAAPVAALPRENVYRGTTVPVIERQTNWVRVLLSGREAVPSAGDPGQLTGWLRVQDVEATPASASIDVDIAARTIDIVHADGTRERVADDYAWGTDTTPTPRGRTFVMLVSVEPSLAYTRGHPLVYLGVQSPTLDGFGGASVAVTAFHYHDTRSGPISNGCLRLGPEAIDRLAQLPEGTPVVIR
jgi:hypothetical protein